MAEARQRDEWNRTSALMALVANINRDPKKTRTFQPADFHPLAAAGRQKCELKAKDLSILKRVFVKKGEGQ